MEDQSLVLSTGDWIRFAVLMASIIGMGVSAFFAVRTRRDARLSQRIQTIALRRQYFSDVRKWADEVSDTITEAALLCDIDPARSTDFFERRHRLRWTLSSLLDRGRWYFPNVEESEYGYWKETAYQGFRQPILDNVLAVYRAVGALDCQQQEPNQSKREIMIKQKREFVSWIQKFVDPRILEDELSRLPSSHE